MEKVICKSYYPIHILGVVMQNGGTPPTAISVQCLVWSELS